MLLFVGNKLSKHGLNPTSIEKLEEDLSNNFSIKSASDKKNIIVKIIWDTLL